MTIQQTIDQAQQHHGAGQLADAEALYRQALDADPDHPVALHFLGVIAHQSGNGASWTRPRPPITKPWPSTRNMQMP